MRGISKEVGMVAKGMRGPIIRSYKDDMLQGGWHDRLLGRMRKTKNGGGWKAFISFVKSRRVPNIIIYEDLQKKMARRWKRSVIVSVLRMNVREDIMSKQLINCGGCRYYWYWIRFFPLGIAKGRKPTTWHLLVALS